MKEHEKAMLAAGWLAVRNLQGEIAYWQDPYCEPHKWDDDEARIYYAVGDFPTVPRVRKPFSNGAGVKEVP